MSESHRQTFRESKIFASKFQTAGSKEKPNMSGELLIKNKADIHYKAGVDAMSQFQFEKAVCCFSKAILLQPQQTQVYVKRAEAYLQQCDFQSAALDYRHACMLEPQTEVYCQRLAFIYYLQGQCLYDLGMFLEALEAFTRAAEIRPAFQLYHMRSLACLSALGRYSDCLRLVGNWLKTGDPSADLFVLSARLHQQLNQMALCYHDLRSAVRLKPGHPEALVMLKRLQESAEHYHRAAVDKELMGELTDALGKINTALDYNPSKARYFLFRGILYRRLKDFNAAIEDFVLAVELCGLDEEAPQGEMQEISEALEDDAQTQLVLTYNDFAVQCFSKGLYREAVVLLNKAVEKQKDESVLFINRGDCFFKQCEWMFALADYQLAEEMDPHNTDIWLRLAVIHNALGLHRFNDKKYQEAGDLFSVAIKYNPTAVRYYENRAKAYSKTDKLEEVKQDAIRVLILDPTNDQVVALLLRLLPGCSLSDIMSCATAQSVKKQLMAKIQAFKQAVSKVSRLDKWALVKNDNQSQTGSHTSLVSGPEQKMKLFKVDCIVKSKQQEAAFSELHRNKRCRLTKDAPDREYKSRCQTKENET
nr:tetratricopeptide repeat protein 16 isoform X3 [Misgurnus anguillicaudatus]